MLNKKKDKINFLDTIIDLFEYIPHYNDEITLFIKLDIKECSDIKKRVENHYSKLFIDLKHNFDKYPNIFRKRWSTWKNLDMEKKQSKLGDF